MTKLNALLALLSPSTLWSNMASPPGLGGGLYMVQMLNFVIIMLNGLLDFAITNVLSVAFGFFYSKFSAPEGQNQKL